MTATCINDTDGDGVCDEDEIAGCTDAEACNYDETATDDNNSCTYPEADNLNCDGSCINDADGDGVCDEDEVGGCTDAGACNYDATATDDNGSCEFTDLCRLYRRRGLQLRQRSHHQRWFLCVCRRPL